MNAENVYSLAYNLLKLNILRIETDDETFAARYLKEVTAKPDCYVDVVLPGVAECAQLLVMASEEMACKKVSRSVFRGMNNIYKAAKAGKCDGYKGAWYDEQGRQCICDGYRAVRLSTPVENIPDAPPVEDRLNLERTMAPCYDYTKTLAMPDIKELRQHIAEEKARRKTERYRKGESINYDFGPGLPMVNAEWLMDMLNIFDVTEAKCCGLIAPIYFKGSNGDGMLLPIRKKGW